MSVAEKSDVAHGGPKGPEITMAARRKIESLCRRSLKEQDSWRSRGPKGRLTAYERFQELVRTIADLTDRSYEEAYNEAIEEWILLHFCEYGKTS